MEIDYKARLLALLQKYQDADWKNLTVYRPDESLKETNPEYYEEEWQCYLIRSRLYQHKIDTIEQVIHLLDVDIEYEPTVQGRAKSLSDTGIFEKNRLRYNL